MSTVKPHPDTPRPKRAARPASSVPGLAPRRAAAAAITSVLARETNLDEALLRHRPGPQDEALARAIAVTALRRFGTIRAALAARLDKGLPADPGLTGLLAAGAAQVLFLEVADHAAVDLSVRLAQASPKTRHLAGLVNAILRRLVRDRDAILAAAPPRLDLPDWLARRWDVAYGPDRTDRIAAAQIAGAGLDLTCRRDPALWAERLGGTLLPTGSVRLADRRPVHELPGYGEGAWWVQDAAAALPARLVAATPGLRVLDVCAAPGGKTAQLAAAGARVTALDRSAARLERVGENLARLRLDAEIVCGDAFAFTAEPFGAVLLDAPCSATGTIRRHPDIPWHRGERDVLALADLQRRLLDRAADLLRPGGLLVYCVCSLEPEEGEGQAEAFLARRPDFAREPIEAAPPGLDPDFVTPAGDLRTVPDLWPGLGGLDGFYACALRRTAGRSRGEALPHG